MKNDEVLKKLLEDEVFLKILKELTGKLPIKRVYEFSVIKYLLNHEEISLKQARNEILKYIEDVDDNSIIHAFQYLNQNYYDSAQVKNNIKCFELDGEVLGCTWDFKKVIQNKKYRMYIEDVINYALIRYEKEFESKYYGVPFFKLYEQYQMIDAALLSNYTKIHSSFRGSGLIANGKEYFLFVDLHKEEDIKESINYKDKFIDSKYFQWQSPNATSQSSERGQNIILNKQRAINLHILSLSNEPFSTIIDSSIEKKQLFKDYFLYDYKKPRISEIIDEEGDIINDRYVSSIKSNKFYRKKNNQFFKTEQLLQRVKPYEFIKTFNNNVALQITPKKYSDENTPILQQNETENIRGMKDDIIGSNKELRLKDLFNKQEISEYETDLNGGPADIK